MAAPIGWRVASELSSSRMCFRCLLRSKRFYSTPTVSAASGPQLLNRLRGDLKTALKEKDTNRLNVLRGVLADITNASKGPSPLKTDVQIAALLRKRAAAAKAAAQEFTSHGRDDLKEKEDAQALVLEEYAGGVELLSEADIRGAVLLVKQNLEGKGEKVDKGVMLRRLVGVQGALEGKNVEKKLVADCVSDVLAGKL